MNTDDTERKPQIQISTKTLILILIFLIGLYFLLPKLIGLPAVIKLLVHINKLYFALAIIFEFLCYVGAASLLGVILSRLGYKIKFWNRFKISSIASFAIHFFPISSFGEGAVDYYFLRRQKVEPGSILLMLVLRIIFTYASFLLIFLLGLVLVPTTPFIKISPKIISLIIFLLVFAMVWYLLYLYHHKSKFQESWNRFFNFFGKTLTALHIKHGNIESRTKIFEDIYRGIGLFGKKKRSSLFALASGILYWMGDVTCFYFVFLSFGYQISWGVLIFSYCIATLIGMISFLPGGIGVTEGSLALIFSSLGVPGTIALTSILVYRLLSFWVWIPVGFYSFLTLTKKKQ